MNINFDFENMEIPYSRKVYKYERTLSAKRKKVERTKSFIMKRAWRIRREAAKKFGCKVMDVDFGSCLSLAWGGE